MNQTSINMGIGVGNALATTISWSLYHSTLLGFVHGIFGWCYIAYYAYTR